MLTEVTALFPDGVRTLHGEELALGYRRSFFTDHPEAVVLRAKLALHGGDQEAIKARMEELSAKRRASQPLEMPSAGGATCADVLALIKKVQDTVFTATGVTLEPEVKIIR